jgi:serine/threonine protein kinase
MGTLFSIRWLTWRHRSRVEHFPHSRLANPRKLARSSSHPCTFIPRVCSCMPRQTFSELPDANKINFVDSPGIHLSTLLPHLGVPPPHGPPVHRPPTEKESTAVDLLQRLLIYPPDSRFSAEGAMSHPWLLSSGKLVLPRAALASVTAAEHAAETYDSKTAAEWLKVFFVPGSPKTE